MALIDIPAYALGDQELWTPKLVKEALVEAFVTIERTTGRVGPKAAQAAWPVVYDLTDIWEQRRTETNKLGRHAKPQITALAIQRAELVVMGGHGMAPWLRGPMADHPLRPKLEMWVLHEAGKSLGRTRYSLRDLCAMRGWAERSFYRDVERAAGTIAGRLNRLSIQLW